jgi:hypothetical protein
MLYRVRQYRTRVSQWGLDKNIKPEEMRSIVRKRQQRKLVEVNKGELIFQVRGYKIEPQKIDRWMKRHEVSESALYAPSPAACRLIYDRRYLCMTLTSRSYPIRCGLSNYFRTRLSASESYIFSSNSHYLTRRHCSYGPEPPNVVSRPFCLEYSSASRQ